MRLERCGDNMEEEEERRENYIGSELIRPVLAGAEESFLIGSQDYKLELTAHTTTGKYIHWHWTG